MVNIMVAIPISAQLKAGQPTSLGERPAAQRQPDWQRQAWYT